jgi:4-methoxybenzoate monooxygenase (O-demethylating)
MIARLEVEVLLTALAERVKQVELVGETVLDINNTTRGFAKLPVRFRA